MAPKKAESQIVDVVELATDLLSIRVVGTSPLIFNSMSQKAKLDLIAPPQKKNKAARETQAKHNPPAEYRNSFYRSRNPDSETLIVFPGGGAKASIMAAAIEIPGAAKAQVGRLVHVETENIPIWGIPQLRMDVTKMAGMVGAPDIRTRGIMSEWCAEFHVRYIKPNLNDNAVANLISAAGLVIGWGDYRLQKGKGAFGAFKMVREHDAEFARIRALGGRAAQEDAIENFTFYDHEAEQLYAHWEAETKRRDLKVV